jgi:hypothetical protein
MTIHDDREQLLGEDYHTTNLSYFGRKRVWRKLFCQYRVSPFTSRLPKLPARADVIGTVAP